MSLESDVPIGVELARRMKLLDHFHKIGIDLDDDMAPSFDSACARINYIRHLIRDVSSGCQKGTDLLFIIDVYGLGLLELSNVQLSGMVRYIHDYCNDLEFS
jgi:hypothetical protein